LPSPSITNPVPASYLGVSISVSNMFPAVIKSILPSLLMSFAMMPLMGAICAIGGSDLTV